jgi:hypothetical protein
VQIKIHNLFKNASLRCRKLGRNMGKLQTDIPENKAGDGEITKQEIESSW